jgi:hypothetical protein
LNVRDGWIADIHRLTPNFGQWPLPEWRLWQSECHTNGPND